VATNFSAPIKHADSRPQKSAPGSCPSCQSRSARPALRAERVRNVGPIAVARQTDTPSFRALIEPHSQHPCRYWNLQSKRRRIAIQSCARQSIGPPFRNPKNHAGFGLSTGLARSEDQPAPLRVTHHRTLQKSAVPRLPTTSSPGPETSGAMSDVVQVRHYPLCHSKDATAPAHGKTTGSRG